MQKKFASILVFIVIIISSLALVPICVCEKNNQNKVLVVEITGDINYATETLVKDAIDYAHAEECRLIIITIDTPGGLLDSVKNIMTMISSSSIPVCVYVYPVGAVAWSGGTFILVASHIAAMAPGTTIGSCQPVEYFSGVPINYSKYVNALSQLMASHAKLHSRNETVAMKFVRENLNLDAERALKMGVIEVIATDLEELLIKLEKLILVKISQNGLIKWIVTDKETKVENQIARFTFDEISKAEVIHYSPSLQSMIMKILSNPFVSSLLLIIGIFSLLIGIKTPGYGAETAGAIMILLALIGYGVIGINIAAIILIGIGFCLVLAEIKTGIGMLVLAGVVCILIGAFLLFPSPNWLMRTAEIEEYRRIFVLASVLVAGVFSLIVYKVAEAQKMKAKTGVEALIGKEGVALTDLSPEGFVKIEGETWRAISQEGSIEKGERVRVVSWRGIKLVVEKQK